MSSEACRSADVISERPLEDYPERMIAADQLYIPRNRRAPDFTHRTAMDQSGHGE
jgi:hypothetical protein